MTFTIYFISRVNVVKMRYDRLLRLGHRLSELSSYKSIIAMTTCNNSYNRTFEPLFTSGVQDYGKPDFHLCLPWLHMLRAGTSGMAANSAGVIG